MKDKYLLAVLEDLISGVPQYFNVEVYRGPIYTTIEVWSPQGFRICACDIYNELGVVEQLYFEEKFSPKYNYTFDKLAKAFQKYYFSNFEKLVA